MKDVFHTTRATRLGQPSMRLLFIFLLLPALLFSQSKEEKKILNILDQQTKAWNQGDFDRFMIGYLESDSLMYIGKNGVTYGFQSTLANYKKNYAGADKMGQLSFDILHLKKLGKKHYLVVGKWKLKRTAGDVGGHYTLTFEKRNGNWVIIADHSS
jgi:hypothetical protein